MLTHQSETPRPFKNYAAFLSEFYLHGTTKRGWQHICLWHGLLNIFSSLLRPTARGEKKDCFQNISDHRQCTWSCKGFDRDGSRLLDPRLMWLWCRPAAAALIPPLAWELPYATGKALKKQKKNQQQKIITAILTFSIHHLDQSTAINIKARPPSNKKIIVCIF